MKTKKEILVVDDEDDIRVTVQQVLQDEGYAVRVAKDGKDCLSKVKKKKPDLILLDILMPGLKTKEILTKLKGKIPIMFLTVVRLSEFTKEKLMAKSMVDYIEKPFNNKDLIKRVKKALK